MTTNPTNATHAVRIRYLLADRSRVGRECVAHAQPARRNWCRRHTGSQYTAFGRRGQA